MARRRFFVSEIRRGTAELTGGDAEHLVRVLRVEPGQIFEVSDNNRIYLAEVQTARKSLVSFAMKEELPLSPFAAQIKLVCALFKFDHFEWLIEKATELGVGVIQPVEATRSERGLFEASVKRRGRWERIALEASQQSRRDRLPEVRPAIKFDFAIEQRSEISLLLDEAESARSMLSQLPETKRRGQTISLLLGPEGGWTDSERESACDAGWSPSSLSNTILRAETAGIAALAIIHAVWNANEYLQSGLTPAR